jgi:hypothetical protein
MAVRASGAAASVPLIGNTILRFWKRLLQKVGQHIGSFAIGELSCQSGGAALWRPSVFPALAGALLLSVAPSRQTPGMAPFTATASRLDHARPYLDGIQHRACATRNRTPTRILSAYAAHRLTLKGGSASGAIIPGEVERCK